MDDLVALNWLFNAIMQPLFSVFIKIWWFYGWHFAFKRKDREFAPPVYDSLEDFEPRIITDPELKPKINTDIESNKKKIQRTRYISTELGIREKLVCSILTSPDTLKTLGKCLIQKIFVRDIRFQFCKKLQLP